MPRTRWERDGQFPLEIHQMRSGRTSAMAWENIFMRSSGGRSRKSGKEGEVVVVVAVDILDYALFQKRVLGRKWCVVKEKVLVETQNVQKYLALKALQVVPRDRKVIQVQAAISSS